MSEERPPNPLVARGNLVVVLLFSWLWLTPVVQFWGAVHGVTRPHSYPPGDLAPSLAWFLVGLAVCFLPTALPARYYEAWEGRGAARVYEAVGIRRFKRFATNGDLINRIGRRRDSAHRVVRDASSARAWAHQAVGAERNHLVFLLMGLFSAVHALRIGWPGWALLLIVGNVVFNAYPILLQRYNRVRVARVCPGWGLAPAPTACSRPRNG